MSSNERLPRAILPKAGANSSRYSEPNHDEVADRDDGISMKPMRSSPQIRSNIRSACLACRQRRSKCTGGLPCSRCQTLGGECVYEEGQDRRTRAIRERGKEELELHKKVLGALCTAIRDGGDKAILALVRQNASLQDMAAAIDGEDFSEESQQDSQYNGASSSRTSNSPEARKRSISALDRKVDHSNLLADLPRGTAEQNSSVNRYVTANDADETDAKQHWRLPSVLDPGTIAPHRQDVPFPHMLAPLHDPASAIHDHISSFYLQFRKTGGQMIRQGFPRELVLGHAEVRCDLVFRARQNSDPFNIYTWASAVVNGYPELDIFFRLSWLVFMVRFMRWSVDMTQANFEHLPDLMKPTSTQVSVPHAPFIDLAPLPQLRDALINKPRDYCAAFQLSGVSISWDRPLEDAVSHDPATGNMTVSRAFEDHISDPNHLVFGRAIFSIFPDLRGNIHTVGDEFIPARTLVSPVTNAVSVPMSIS